jgi:predicted transcriptional regulator
MIERWSISYMDDKVFESIRTGLRTGSSIAEKLGVAKSTVSKAADRLEDKNLIERRGCGNKTTYQPNMNSNKDHRSVASKDPQESVSQAAQFLSMSIKAVDEVFIEDGYAHRHPELLAAFMQAALFDFHATHFSEILTRITTQ